MVLVALALGLFWVAELFDVLALARTLAGMVLNEFGTESPSPHDTLLLREARAQVPFCLVGDVV